MKKCKKNDCQSRISPDDAPDYCPDHNELNNMSHPTLEQIKDKATENLIVYMATVPPAQIKDFCRGFIDKLVDDAHSCGKRDAFVKGFIAGFEHSGEGYNGEYVHSAARNTLSDDLRKAAEKELDSTISPQ